MNVYVVQLVGTIKCEQSSAFAGKESSHLYVTASTFENALAAVREKHPSHVVRSISQQNYLSLPIVAGE